ncbi:hypothetical protein [uncultured Vibrio sp.]|uniref:hypothetical protein n=1 Tax=uncultured Vibrio sp. TaxID=114054 RepID=UPI00091904AB|nr:hypothetical protein [uncultured Vibrio sp.]OIQ25323.1 MAG: hypothetical protein BM561_06035 [Vibrio sp. MedPE-SWchi]
MNRNTIILFTIFSFISVLSLSIFILMTGHLHEDAYILFIYAENLANGHGISYYPGGSKTEGATDFLWMAILSSMNYIGLDVAISAALVNSIGITISSFAILSILKNNQQKLLALLYIIILVTSDIVSASISGFSTGLYTGLVSLIFISLIKDRSESIYLVPILSIVIALVRPDGVIIGIISTIVGLHLTIIRNKKVKKYLLLSTFSLIVGVIYFIWRYNYFGYLLPLPLYVKSSSSLLLPGWNSHVHWINNNFLLITSTLLLLLTSKEKRILSLVSTPILALFITLTFATLSQNIAHRFQAPVTINLILLSAYLSSRVDTTKSRFFILLFVIPALIIANNFKSIKNEIGHLRNDTYINYFPFYLQKSLDDSTVIALTEAGRFAYWADGKKIDLVGLNTAKTAINGASVKLLEKESPDLIFIHIAGTINIESLCDVNICEMDIDDITDSIIYNNDWRKINNGVFRSPYVVYEYLENNADSYAIYTVKYFNKYRHIYALKSDSKITKEEFVEALKKSFNSDYHLSYLDMKKII